MEKDLLDASISRFDIFRTILGLILISLSGYLLYKDFFNLKPESFKDFLFNNFNYYLLFSSIIILFVSGMYLFLAGISDMESNYDMERTLIQVQVINSLKSIEDFDASLGKVDIDKKHINRFKTSYKNKIKKLIEEFE